MKAKNESFQGGSTQILSTPFFTDSESPSITSSSLLSTAPSPEVPNNLPSRKQTISGTPKKLGRPKKEKSPSGPTPLKSEPQLDSNTQMGLEPTEGKYQDIAEFIEFARVQGVKHFRLGDELEVSFGDAPNGKVDKATQPTEALNNPGGAFVTSENRIYGKVVDGVFHALDTRSHTSDSYPLSVARPLTGEAFAKRASLQHGKKDSNVDQIAPLFYIYTGPRGESNSVAVEQQAQPEVARETIRRDTSGLGEIQTEMPAVEGMPSDEDMLFASVENIELKKK